MASRSAELLNTMCEASRERILESALTLFARSRSSPDTASRALFAEEAGVSKRSLYSYFEGKLALLKAIFERSMEEVGETFVVASEGATPAEALAALVRSAFEAVRRNWGFWRLSYQIRMEPGVLSGLGPEVAAWFRLILGRIEELLARDSAVELDAPGPHDPWRHRGNPPDEEVGP